MDDLARDILTQIQSGKSGFAPADGSHKALVEFQPIAKRIEWAKKQEYIQDARFLRGGVGDSILVTQVMVLGSGLTLDGEQSLLGDGDPRLF
jgi:hypothetical protein